MARYVSKKGVMWRDNPHFDPTLAEHGLTCVACHVRNGKIYGPPPGETPPQIDRQKPGAHAPAERLAFFESAEFCAECHQFTMKNRAGEKPLQNTYVEWQESPYGKAKATCVFCHMPDRRHLWRGIHSADTVGGALGSSTELTREGEHLVARMTLINEGAGHAMPTYVTPRMAAKLAFLNDAGIIVATEEYVIQRRVVPGKPWREISDTRLLPLQAVSFSLRAPARDVVSVRQWVEVEPDFFYVGVFEGLLTKNLPDEGRRLIEKALAEARASPYIVDDETLTVADELQ